MTKRSIARKIEPIIFHTLNAVFMVAFVIAMIYPFLNTIAVSFNSAVDTVRGGITILPRKFSMQNYKMVFSSGTIYQAFLISVSRTLINMVTGVFFTTMLAYVLSRPGFILKKPFTLIVVLSMYVNAGLIPTYFLMRNLHLINNYLVYIIPGMINAFNFLVLRTFLKSIPESIIESVRIDGGSDFTIFIKIVIPLAKPALATVGLFIAVEAWNSWFDTMIYTSAKTYLHSLQFKLMEYLQSSQSAARSASDVGAMALAQTSNLVTPVSIRAAITVVAAVPILFIYPFMQRYFVIGMNVGGVKE